jgi:hypothetical protein
MSADPNRFHNLKIAKEVYEVTRKAFKKEHKNKLTRKAEWVRFALLVTLFKPDHHQGEMYSCHVWHWKRRMATNGS